ncbi:hypothetical protein Bpfe_000702, partial [Biomphalaria pfeifferi]
LPPLSNDVIGYCVTLLLTEIGHQIFIADRLKIDSTEYVRLQLGNRRFVIELSV